MAPNLGRLQPTDIAYLESKKSLHIPAGPFLEVLLSHYFLYTHPCLPIINEAEFWKMFRQDGYTEPSFSLLVLQAMLFVASSVSIPVSVSRIHMSLLVFPIGYTDKMVVYSHSCCEAAWGTVSFGDPKYVLSTG
jgi:hypothetical protein